MNEQNQGTERLLIRMESRSRMKPLPGRLSVLLW